ncbi:MAG: hypothetical protein JRE43_08105, partial [Deltaproteobacteria bacterium]|nr:hypothetical protein [Deltaproteobacteria bacterium]
MIGADYFTRIARNPTRTRRTATTEERAYLQDGWVLANHILVSFHAAFISSVLVLPSLDVSKGEVLQFIFVSPETVLSAIFVYITFHVGVAIHEIGHFLTAARLNALNDSIAEEVKVNLQLRGVSRWLYFAKLFALAPWGRATGIKRQGLNYYPDAPFNLAVAAAGPRASRNLALIMLPPSALLLGLGLWLSAIPAIYVGRLLLGIGIVAALDFRIADRGKYREFQQRERKARETAEALPPVTGWFAQAAKAKQQLVDSHMQEVLHPNLGPVTAPWQFRNCGMGGRHTIKEYPESNISMQEAMFMIRGAQNYLDAQEMTVALQSRLKEIIENAEGCRVMGIGLEGGLAPYIDRGEYRLPEVRLWAMMKQAIEECGYRPGEDVAIALDPAMSELEIAYREEFGVPDSVGTYLFWRDESKTVLDRDGVLELYDHARRELDIPLLSIEDGFSEDDHEGWKLLHAAQGERLLIIGDDLITTNDATIEDAADRGLVNSALIKANQIGTLHETVLAMLVALSKGLSLVISHRSKSPNDDMEAHIALSTNALGLKAGGGANTERLVKYHSVATQMAMIDRGMAATGAVDGSALVVDLSANEEPTNAGIPTVGVEADISVPMGSVRLSFRGATPLGTSAGTGEAVHLIDGVFEGAEHAETVAAHGAILDETEPGVYAFRKGVTFAQVEKLGDDDLSALFLRSRRYQGKGCMNAVDNVREVIAPYFRGRDLASSSFLDIDRALLQLERRTAERRGKLAPDASAEEAVKVTQRKQNLGMNAVLSASLAMARAIANVRGKQFWELMREEMLVIIERLANEHGISVDGIRWEDYVAALREVAGILEGKGTPIHAELRRLTGVYDDPQLAAPSSLPLRRPPRSGEVAISAAAERVQPTGASGIAAADTAGLSPSPSAGTVLSEAQHKAILEVSAAFYKNYATDADPDQRRIALRQYLRVRTETMKTVRPFEIVNDKIIRTEDRVLVPYLAGDDFLVHDVRGGEVTASSRRLQPGTIVTDELLAEMTGVRGDVIDLDGEIYGYAPDEMPEIRISRVRDMTALLKKLGASANYYGAAIYLRGIVMRLCEHSFRGFLDAKNLRSEVHQLNQEIVEVLKCPFADRLRLGMRVLVRKASGLLLRPSLIDQVWVDSIDLSEVHIRGSRIANELRRSSHHALGKSTLELATAYHEYFENGNAEGLAALGFGELSDTDEAARQETEPRALLERIVHNLEKLLGSAQIATRIREWQDVYAEALLRCDFGESLEGELGTTVEGGIRARNRWVFGHHLRILGKKVEEVSALLDGADYGSELSALEQLDPADPDFDAPGVEASVRDIVARLTGTLRERCQTALFSSLYEALAAFESDDFLSTVRLLARVRDDIELLADSGGFPEQRYLLIQLDCLLEEMGYLATRHIASSYQKDGVRLDECFEIISISARNLAHGGLYSEELCELAKMLAPPGRNDVELLNVIEALQDCYHRVLQRTSLSYEALDELLGLSKDELRSVIANLQRYMHDLHSIANLTDLAKTNLRARTQDAPQIADEVIELPESFDVLHLAHLDEIAARLANPNVSLRETFGNKGGSLIRISHAGIPTRQGFVLPTDLARSRVHERDPERFANEIATHLAVLEQDIARRDGQTVQFGNPQHPLLLAVRGGSVFSMPGILSTIVFVGINDEIAAALAAEDPWYAYDTYRRFLTSWGASVMGVDLERFHLVEEAKETHGIRYKNDLPWEAMRDIAHNCKKILREHGDSDLLDASLENPERQLTAAVTAVIESWNTKRAERYREIKGISDTWNTAVVIQQMSSGNRRSAEVHEGMDETRCSLTGVIPKTMVTRLGLRRLTGDIKFSAAGDDLVGGLTAADSFEPIARLRSLMPMLERRIDHAGTRIRMARGTDVEIEFTVERGVLSILQARTAVTTLKEEVRSFDQPGEATATGIGIRGGAFRGRVAFNDADLAQLATLEDSDSDGVLLLLENPTPNEIPLILSAGGLLAARGGSPSH